MLQKVNATENMVIDEKTYIKFKKNVRLTTKKGSSCGIDGG
jgi:hypothetical protein